MRAKKSRKRKNIRSLLLFIALAILITKACLTLILYVRLSPQLCELGIAQAQKEIKQRINKEILDACAEDDLVCEELIRIERNGQGEILFIETDAEKLNRMRSTLVDRLSQTMDQKKGFTLSVPAGSLTDLGILSWIDFPLKVKYVPIGAVSGEIITEFADSGVNQTIYRVSAEIRVSFTLLLPGENPQSEVVTTIPLGEVVIIGKVPHLYSS